MYTFKDKAIDAIAGAALFGGFLWLYVVASHADLAIVGF